MQIPEGILTLGSLIIALLSIILSIILANRSRVEPYKKALYDQQMKSAIECADALVAAQVAIDIFHSTHPECSILDNEEKRSHFRENVYLTKLNLRITILRNSPHLPTKVFGTLSEYLAFFELILGEMRTDEGFASIGRNIQQLDPWEIFYADFALAIISIRDFIGVGPLTSSIAQTVGSDKQQPEIENQNVRELIRLLQRNYDVPSSQILGIYK